MSLGIEVTFNIEPFVRDLKALGKRALPAMARAINRGASAGKTAMARAIMADTGLGSRFTKDEIKVTTATSDNLVARVSVTGRRIPLIGFKARGPEPSRGRGRGVSYTLPTGRGRIENAFIATMGSGHRGVFKRVTPSTRKGNGAWGNNLPIIELRGPSLPHVFEKHLPVFKEAAEPVMVSTMQHEINFRSGQGA
jgi:hypothetical protein